MSNQAASYEAGLVSARTSAYRQRLYLARISVDALRHLIDARIPEIQHGLDSLRHVLTEDQEAGASTEGKEILRELTTLTKTLNALKQLK